MNYDYLYFLTFNKRDKSLETSQQVFAEQQHFINGSEFFLWVVGDSHFIGSHELEFYELCSCKPLKDAEASLRIDEFPSALFESKFSGGTAKTKVWVEKFRSNFKAKNYDLSHDFGPDAFTGIKIFDDGYESLHTYPEYDALVFSRTEFVFD